MRARLCPPVLVVDDNDDTREAIVRMLGIRGFPTIAAADGGEALGYLRSGGTPSAIILDLRMPVLDGFGVHAELTANPAWAAIPVILFSAAMPITRLPGVMAAVSKGADAPDTLLDAVAKACSQREPGEPAEGHS